MINKLKKIYFRLILLLDNILNTKFFKRLLVNRVSKRGVDLKFQIQNSITLDRSIFYYETETLNWIEKFRQTKSFGILELARCIFDNCI